MKVKLCSPHNLLLFARKINSVLLLFLNICKIFYLIGYRGLNLKGPR